MTSNYSTESVKSYVHQGFKYFVDSYVLAVWSSAALLPTGVRCDGVIFKIKTLLRMNNVMYATLTPVYAPLTTKKRCVQEIQVTIWDVRPVTLLELATARNDLDELINAYVKDNS